jgi:hypothetical protein
VIATRRRTVQEVSALENGWATFTTDRDEVVEVVHGDRGWQVRVGGCEASHTLLDVALGRLLPLNNLELAALTVRILEWDAAQH